ncbi:MAG: TetR/AcrR family transcriptional regulator [Liquorilactobacillus nagelii]|jgi:AcrR family transcriptional regulator|uniref:TetR/AcrR family transcriptional regulator n=1 Tax=Liquorilactobacillus nagelii TaxID=82688 RepID=UPI00242F43DA|nr:TetR/AcrR family transcriptional regulator [Liquorilactobacillus nagelii]MCI1632702.1 TetR/AcrR family transcriptional regulator [Liquorilactobacillus nagelii]
MPEDRIIQAFLDLIQKKSYQKISISEIMQQAQLTRTYFYQFFDSKTDLAREAFFALVADILKYLSRAFINQTTVDDQSTLAGVNFFLDNASKMRLLLSFQIENFNFVVEFQNRIKEVIQQQVHQNSNASTQKIDYFAELFAVSALTTISWALKQPKISAAEIVELINTCVSDGLIKLI